MLIHPVDALGLQVEVPVPLLAQVFAGVGQGRFPHPPLND